MICLCLFVLFFLSFSSLLTAIPVVFLNMTKGSKSKTKSKATFKTKSTLKAGKKDGTRDIETYSRQQLVLGENGQNNYFNSSIAIMGFDGLAAEIAKNCLLAGSSHLYLFDDHPEITKADYSSNVCKKTPTLLYFCLYTINHNDYSSFSIINQVLMHDFFKNSYV